MPLSHVFIITIAIFLASIWSWKWVDMINKRTIKNKGFGLFIFLLGYFIILISEMISFYLVDNF